MAPQPAAEESHNIRTTNRSLKKDKYAAMFKEQANSLIAELTDFCQTTDFGREKLYVKKGSKPAQSQNIRNPEKRSKYIGVARNASKWQTLV